MLIKVRVLPGSKKNRVTRKTKESYRVEVREKALRGEANRAAARLLASHLGISPSGVRLVRGAKRPNKIFEIIK
jgi:uncharacterized protein YggU (UPF0235/DUF167 family)